MAPAPRTSRGPGGLPDPLGGNYPYEPKEYTDATDRGHRAAGQP